MRYAIIVAGGTGTRMNAGTPKQFLMLGGKPMLAWPLETFHLFDPGMQIIVVLPEDQVPRWKELCKRYRITAPHQVVQGGETRYQSVKNALWLLPSEGWTAVHDGARPLVNITLIERMFSEAGKFGNAIPVLPVQESVRQVEGKSSSPVNRDHFVTIQTPQVFPTETLKRAYQHPFIPSFTDDATVAEKSGEKIHLAEGMAGNIKITWPADLVVAEALLPFLSTPKE
jgi:2-C-methyl-D-erythritol 4-phosphate cytidylyltransferase